MNKHRTFENMLFVYLEDYILLSNVRGCRVICWSWRIQNWS